MRRFGIRRLIAQAVWLALIFVISGMAHSATVQIFPGSSRSDNTVYCIEGEIDKIRFLFIPDAWAVKGKYKVEGLQTGQGAKDLFLLVDLPSDVRYIGTTEELPTLDAVNVEPITHNGAAYARYTVSLNTGNLLKRVNNSELYSVDVWIKSLRKLQGSIYWQMRQGSRVLADVQTFIKTTGAIDNQAPLPKDTILYAYYGDRNPPPAVVDEVVSLYRRIGITHVTENRYGQQFEKKLKDAGIKLIGQRSGSFIDLMEQYLPEGPVYKKVGLYNSVRDFADKMLTVEKETFISSGAERVDGFIWDLEPDGPAVHPGYDDRETIKAFCREKGRPEISPEEIKARYAKEYYDYRMKLMGMPVSALEKMVHSVRPGIPLFICQGNGLPIGELLDYKAYDEVADYHMPMIYTDSCLDFYNNTRQMADYVGRKKLIPAVADAPIWRVKAYNYGKLLLDYMSAGINGCGFCVFNGLPDFDGGQIYELYEGSRLLAFGEDFYRDGKASVDFSVRGIPFAEKSIRVGSATIDLSQPEWKNYLVSLAHKLKGETLITLLNFHDTENVYAEIKNAGFSDGRYLVNPYEKKYVTAGGEALLPPAAFREGVLIKVNALRPGLWFVTGDRKALTGCAPVSTESLRQELLQRKSTFAKNLTAIPLGKKGNITLGYQEVVNDKNDKQVCLQVVTPSQTVSFTDSGARIWKWVVNGNDIVINGDLTYGGVGLDLFWLPALGRWSGDGMTGMTLKKAENTGNEAVLVYGGSFNTVRVDIEKTYRIPFDKTVVYVSTTCTNTNAVAPEPRMFSYWSHNWFGGTQISTGPRDFLVTGPDGVRIYPYGSHGYVMANEKNGDLFAEDVMKEAVNGKSWNVFGEYFTDHRLGIMLRIPDDFLQIYRYGGDKQPTAATLEWMSAPVTLALGRQKTWQFSVEVFPSVTEQQFKEMMLAPAPGKN
ncbi:MAG: hypothetical protein V2A65_10735 [Candidatus Omnitrophota bacterium]